MNVWLLYTGYDGDEDYEGEKLVTIVDSEEKAKNWVFDSVYRDIQNKIAELEHDIEEMVLIDEDGPYIPSEDHPYYKRCMDDLYFYTCQFNSYVHGRNAYIIKSPNEYERWCYHYEKWEVE